MKTNEVPTECSHEKIDIFTRENNIISSHLKRSQIAMARK